ncbi:hypothetical protein Cs7R123_39810 [Catellatospora sp. TT07R-123]|uniref:hypothetical protein n=1 Tax=Catellatospora sp. TT07R-123 TaxID=2733863 RepID=UPI001B08A3A9|nr:hypothetical protein [Catellatospora sp. TT07R-123]GHJ46639.1 hypothetical protein Cs7R123_39810 [Catellatospora sp. TT07R-123]
MTGPERVRELIDQCWEAPRGGTQVALAEEAIAQADAIGDDELRFQARMAATEAYYRAGAPAQCFAVFSWCLARYDERPDQYAEAEPLLLWHFKYQVHLLPRFPEVPLERAYAVLEEMQRRYQQGGHSLQPVHKLRWLVAAHLGDEAAAGYHYELWQSASRDDNSDCDGCDPTAMVQHLGCLGRDEDAIELTGPVLEGRLTCAEQPQEILTALLLPFLRTGRPDEARRAHLRAYRRLRQHPAKLGSIAEHVRYLAHSGDVARGLDVVERHLPWLEDAPSPAAEMEFAAAAALLLRLLAGTGHGDLTVRGSRRTVAVLADELAARATGLAARFDARNGTGAQAARVAALLQAEPVVEPTPPAAGWRSPRPRIPAETVPDPLADVPGDADLDTLLGLVEEALRRDLEPRVEALWLRIRPLSETGPLTALQHGRLADLAGMRLHSEAAEETERVWTEALEWYVQAGDLVRQHRIRGRLGLHRCRQGMVEAGLAEVQATTDYLLVHGDARDAAGALRRLAVALLHAQEPAEALDVLDRAAVMVEPDPGPRVRLQVMLLRAQALGADGRVHDAADAARALVAQAIADDEPELLGLGEFFLGQGLTMLDDPAGAIRAYDRALAQVLPEPLEREVRERRAILLAGTPRAAEAVDDLAAMVERLVDEDDPEDGDDTDHIRFHLAVALFNAAQSEEAAEAAEEALSGADLAGNQHLADQARHLLAAVHQRLGDPDRALSYLDQLAANLDGFDNAAARARVLEQAGELLFDLDRDGQSAARLGAAAAAYAVARLPLEEVRALRRQCVAAMFADDAELARTVLARADEAARAVPPGLAAEPEAGYELAWLALDGARALAGIGEPEAALARLTGVAQRFEELESFGEALLAELTRGEVLVAVGRAEAAEPVLRGVVNGLPRDSATLPRAAYALAQVLLLTGQDDEARRLAGEYGFELD